MLKLSHAFIERSNLYFIIVLGEIVIGALNGFSTVDVTWYSLGLLCLNFFIAFGLWFIHFEFIGHIQHKETVGGYFMWLLSFFLEAMMVAFIGSSVYINYHHFSVGILIIPTLIFFLATILHLTCNTNIANPNICITANRARLYMAISSLLMLVSLLALPVYLKVMLYLISLYFPVILAIKRWIQEGK